MNNTRFSTALHILSVLNIAEKGAYMSSEWIAGSIQINPVMVRKEIAALKKAGLVESQAGKEGGTRLALSPKKIKIAEVYAAIHPSEVLGRKNQSPNPTCPVGKKINKQLDVLYKDAEAKLMQFLSKKTLADFCTAF